MEKFIGTKFRPTDKVIMVGHDKYTNEPMYRNEFKLTRSYSSYLKAKAAEEERREDNLSQHRYEVDPDDKIEYYNYLARQVKKLKQEARIKGITTYKGKNVGNTPEKYATCTTEIYLPRPGSQLVQQRI